MDKGCVPGRGNMRWELAHGQGLEHSSVWLRVGSLGAGRRKDSQVSLEGTH